MCIISLIVSFVVGSVFGVAIMAIMQVSGRESRREEEQEWRGNSE